MAGICSEHRGFDPNCKLCGTDIREVLPEYDEMCAEAEWAWMVECACCGFQFYRTMTECPMCSEVLPAIPPETRVRDRLGWEGVVQHVFEPDDPKHPWDETISSRERLYWIEVPGKVGLFGRVEWELQVVKE